MGSLDFEDHVKDLQRLGRSPVHTFCNELTHSVNESTGFTPFELVFGQEVRGPLKLFKEQLLHLY